MMNSAMSLERKQAIENHFFGKEHFEINLFGNRFLGIPSF